MTTPLEIGMVCFSSLGGSGTVAVELAHALEGRGHRVTVFSAGRPHRLREGTPHRVIEAVHHPLFSDTPYSLALASTLVAAHRERPLDLVHLHYGVPHAASAMLVRHTLAAAGPAMVVTLHGSDVVTFGTESSQGPVIGACLRSLDAVTTPSMFLQRLASDAFAVSPTVVPNFVDPDVFRPQAARPERLLEVFGQSPPGMTTLVHVSNFRTVKATRTLVPLMQRLTRTLPGGARLVLIGEGPDRERVEADARAAGMADSMRFVAPPPGGPSVLASWVAACDLFVLPSENESFGLAALEALACGVPVIARRVGGVPEVVRDGVTGCLVDDPAELGTAIETLLASGTARRAMSVEAARDARRRFSPDVVVDGFDSVYRRAIGQWRGAP